MIFLLLLCITFTACDSQPKVLTAEEVAENKRKYDLEVAEDEAIKQSLLNASDKKLKSMLSNCRSLINEYATFKNKGPFSIYMIDKYSADVYQYPAGKKSTMDDEERIKDLRDSSSYISFNTNYAILATTDTFSGPKKSVDKYACKIIKGPSIEFAYSTY